MLVEGEWRTDTYQTTNEDGEFERGTTSFRDRVEDDPDDEVRIPAFRMTRFGREVFSLCRAEADTAYLGAVAGALKDRGYRVQLGDWTGEGEQSLFTERMVL